MKTRAMSCVMALSLCFTAALHADVTDADFGNTADGAAVRLFTITNKAGSEASIATYGATLVTLKMPDRAGKVADVVLGFDTIDGYLRPNNPDFGALIGRYANRIHGATFTLDGIAYKLTPNERGSTMHGGKRGFDKVVWTAAKIDDQTIEFTYLSKDGEEGFPGNLTAHVRYSLSDANELKLEYAATTDKDTVVNLTNHSYFNLGGQGSGDVLNAELTINADQYTPVDNFSIPTGKLVDVAGTPFDFRQPHKIGERIKAGGVPGGYDHNFVLNGQDGLHPAATVYDATTGRVMEVSTTEPGVQLYTSNGLNGSLAGKDGKKYPKFGAVCLEAEHFPDSPNEPAFPSTELKPGDMYHSMTVYKFSTRAAATTLP